MNAGYRPFNAENDDSEEIEGEKNENDGNDLDLSCQEGDVRVGVRVSSKEFINLFRISSSDNSNDSLENQSCFQYRSTPRPDNQKVTCLSKISQKPHEDGFNIFSGFI